ncbi:MAG: cytochrome c biogenesis protein ResB [Ideonella sp.]
MRFAITLLCVICIASVIGTVVKQNEPLNNYVNQFGPFWASLFEKFSLFTVYSASWFMLILAFLVLSTSLCIARNTPKIIADLRSYKEHLREQSLHAFHHKADGALAMDSTAALGRASEVLARHGWKAKAQVRPGGTMVAARNGRINKLGYIAAHSSIVLICLGGLSDGDLVVKAQMWLSGKSSFDGAGLIRDVPAEHRLSSKNPTFRGNLLVPEGGRAGTAILSMPDGVVLQDLDFDIELKKFVVEYYDTGMPKLFASDIVIHDHAGGAPRTATVKVNEPVFHNGVAIYQSSFDDGGSKVSLLAQPLSAGGKPFELSGRVGESSQLSNGADKLTLEITALKVINVENLNAPETGGTDVRKVDLGSTLGKHLGSGVSLDKTKTLRNVGPAITYKLRDASGQAREFHNYMVPMTLDGRRVLLAGVRESTAENFRYLRIPVDESDSIDSWLRLRRALDDPQSRAAAARRYASLATPADKPEMAEQLRITGERALALFSGSEAPVKGMTEPTGGLVALSQFIDGSVPEAERSRVAEVLLRILNGSLIELNQLARERDGLKALEAGDAAEAFMTQAVMSISDSYFYPAPMLLQLNGFDQVQASVFQLARAPGKKLVYLGAVLLIFGVFAMLYVRERRLWIWLSPMEASPAGQTRVMMALSTPRRTLDIDAEFEQLRAELLAPAGAAPVTGDTP